MPGEFTVLEEPGAELVAVAYRDVLVPAFPAAQLIDLEVLQHEIACGTASAVLCVDENARPAAVLAIENFPSCGIALGTYLAVHPQVRGRAVGSEMCRALFADFVQHRPDTLLLAETEHPGAHPADPVSGNDPLARAAFFDRMGGRALDLPFFQPALAADHPRVHSMMLVVPPIPAARLDADGNADIRSGVECFLRRYLTATEGTVDEQDLATAELFAALHRGPVIPTLPLSRWAEVPMSTSGYGPG